MAEEHPLERYTNARSRLEESMSNVEELVKKTTALAKQISNWKTLAIQDRYNLLGDSPRHATDATNVLEARDWPTIQEIDETLKQWREARNEAEGAWHALTQDQRQHVLPLPA